MNWIEVLLKCNTSILVGGGECFKQNGEGYSIESIYYNYSNGRYLQKLQSASILKPPKTFRIVHSQFFTSSILPWICLTYVLYSWVNTQFVSFYDWLGYVPPPCAFTFLLFVDGFTHLLVGRLYCSFLKTDLNSICMYNVHHLYICIMLI